MLVCTVHNTVHLYTSSLYVTIYAKRDHVPYFVKNELYTVPDSPVDADFIGVFCTDINPGGKICVTLSCARIYVYVRQLMPCI